MTNGMERKAGKNANNCIEKSTSAKTEISSGRREASTTEADIAAFIDNTDVNLRSGGEDQLRLEQIRVGKPFLHLTGVKPRQ